MSKCGNWKGRYLPVRRLRERPEIKEAMYRDTCDAYVMKYQHEDSQDMDPDIEIDETGL